MGHVFRGFLAVLVSLLLLQLLVNIFISSTGSGRSGSWSLSLSAADPLPVDGQLVTGDSRRRKAPSSNSPPSSSDRHLGFRSLFGRDAFAYLRMLLQGKPLPICPEVPSNLVGPLQNSYSLLSYEKLSVVVGGPSLGPGGRWRPANCTARHRVALIVPYRDRDEHLRIFLHNIHPFVQRQEIDYGIFVIEQSSRGSFNRGMLMNIGFIESLRFYDYDCFIFHDVDLLPENDQNLYWCPTMPRHMSAAVDTFLYKLPYWSIFGGVEAFTRSHFELINGFSNEYFGWGGEDDDLYQRLIFHNLNLTRYPLSVARYRMLRHLKMNPNPKRLNLLHAGPERFERDGLNSLRYILKAIEERKLYTWIHVEIDEQILSPTKAVNSTSNAAAAVTTKENTSSSHSE